MSRIHRIVQEIIEAEALRLPDQRGAATAPRKPSVGIVPRKPVSYGAQFAQTELQRITYALGKVSSNIKNNQYPGTRGEDYPASNIMDPADKKLLKQASDRLTWVVTKLG